VHLQVLKALEAIMDPDFGMNIVECGFVKDLVVDVATGAVTFRLELTTPACPIKDEFHRQAIAEVTALEWVSTVRSCRCFCGVSAWKRAVGRGCFAWVACEQPMPSSCPRTLMQQPHNPLDMLAIRAVAE
jgi:metal-sulfur cluster biosynthetic enzyme